MPKVTFIDHRGARFDVASTTGGSAMQAAVGNGVPGIVGECGGACQCATCHVYVAEPWNSQLPPPTDDEKAMLEGVYAELRPSSRLACAIAITDQLDGIELTLPERQL